MAINVSKSDNNTTFTFTVTGPSTKLDPLIEKWAEYDYNHGFGNQYSSVDGESILTPFSELTTQQKLDAINERIKDVGVSEANSQLLDDKRDEILDTREIVDLDGVNGE